MTHQAEAGVRRRDQILEAIEDFWIEHRFPPTVRELMRIVGLQSPRSVQVHLDKLEAEGRILREKGDSRTVRTPSIDKHLLKLGEKRYRDRKANDESVPS